MRDFFTIIGGMGTAATESYLRLLNQRTPTDCDQDFLDYILVNHATVPDRTSYILDRTKPSFYPALLDDVQQQSQLNPAFMVIICNTAHYFYEQLQQATTVPLLHMPRTAIATLKAQYPDIKRVGLIATQGTLADGIYEQELQQQNYDYTLGDKQLQADVMTLIYDNIKTKGVVDAPLYHQIIRRMQQEFGAEAVILGCTELSLAQEKAADHDALIIDAQSIIVDKSIELALKVRAGKTITIKNGLAD
ncbi:aspartate racemase [Bombilactobacillus bombi]|uniref:Aspartate racemase n=1 Tax=Bombilactobacillus bombi TaxID=1303590 RepID=A0A3R6Z8L6_9LACO|nr:amino acid racemase [Bombilactobacillus bombi]RHW45579.1 aspartate racemase [Bombilactobacillus bombi]